MINSSYPAFGEFFEAVHGFAPYKWQIELAEYVEQHGVLPDRVEVPTGMGKTSTIDVVVWALGQQIFARKSRTIGQRIVHMVERQIVVEGAYSHVERLAASLKQPMDETLKPVSEALKTLSDEALRITSFHGSRRDPRTWLELTGVQVIVTTATQTTLRLLGYGPGVARRTSSIHAGLLGVDSVLLFDEPHLATAQVHAIEDVIALQKQAIEGLVGVPSTSLTLLGATVPPHLDNSDVSRIRFNAEQETERAKELWRAPKPLRLVKTEEAKGKKLVDELLKCISLSVEEALNDEESPQPKIVVVLNSIAVAREAYAYLEKLLKKLKTTNASLSLVTSRTRPCDRADADSLFPEFEGPQIVVATQTLEVGADFSVDKLITELAPWPALAQRLGRLNRDGHAKNPQAIVIIPTDGENNLGTPASQHIYGEVQLNTTGTGLLENDISDASLNKQSEIVDALVPSGEEETLWPSPPRRSGLTFDLIALLLASSTSAGTRTDLTAWLQGPDALSPVEPVTVMWRSNAELIHFCPPLSAEQVEVSLAEAKSLVTGLELSSYSNDAGISEDASVGKKKWKSERLQRVWIRKNNEWSRLESLNAISPGSTLVFSSELGGYTCEHGVKPGSAEYVRDVSFELSMKNGFPSWTELPVWSSADVKRIDKIKPGMQFWEAFSTASNLENVADMADDSDRSLRERKKAVADMLEKTLEFRPLVDFKFGRILIRKKFTDGNQILDHVRLDEHSTLTSEIARESIKAAGAQKELIDATFTAAFLHDHAKAIPGFQKKLGNTSEGSNDYVAKTLDGQRRNSLFCDLPENFDHALAASRAAQALGFDDLVCHLIGSHHGGLRGVHRGWQHTAIWVDRYLELSRRYGPWGLAWLESSVRLADWNASSNPEGIRKYSSAPLNQEMIDWLQTDNGEINIGLGDDAIPLTGLSGPPLALNWFASVGVLALAAKEDQHARMNWIERTPVLYTTAGISNAVDSFGPVWERILNELNTKIKEAHQLFPGYKRKDLSKTNLPVPKLGTKNHRLTLTHQAIEWLANEEWSEETQDVAHALWQPHQGRIMPSDELVDGESPKHVVSVGIYELPIPMLAKNSTVFKWPVPFEPQTVWDVRAGYSDETAARGAGGLDMPKLGTNETAQELLTRSALLPLALFGALSCGEGLEPGGRGTVSVFNRRSKGEGSGSIKRRTLELPIPDIPVTLAGLSGLTHHCGALTDGRKIQADYELRGDEKMTSATGSRIVLLPPE